MGLYKHLLYSCLSIYCYSN